MRMRSQVWVSIVVGQRVRVKHKPCLWNHSDLTQGALGVVEHIRRSYDHPYLVRFDAARVGTGTAVYFNADELEVCSTP